VGGLHSKDGAAAVTALPLCQTIQMCVLAFVNKLAFIDELCLLLLLLLAAAADHWQLEWW
jgi:hypothetical protein